MRKKIEEAKILITGLVKNCEKTIQNEVQSVHNAFSDAKTTSWLIIESDSSDETLERLSILSNQYPLKYISLGKLSGRYPGRTERLAYCRNTYLSEIVNNSEYSDVDYVVVCDLDGINKDLSKDAVLSCWECGIDWDACFANQKKFYYDIWALRHELWCPNDWIQEELFLRKFNVDEFTCRFTTSLSRMIHIPSNAKPIKVISAFGGLGIYKKELMLKGKYEGLTTNNLDICEHVTFHQTHLKDNNLYIMPSLVNGILNNHSIKRTKLYILFLYIATRFFKLDLLKDLKNKLDLNKFF